MKKQVKIIFTISILLNLLLAGLIIGSVCHEVNKTNPWEQTKASLSEQTRKIMKSTFKEKGKEVFPLFREAYAQKQQMKEIIMAEEFDPAAYDTMAGQMLDLDNTLSKHKMETLKGIISKLPKEERAKLANHIVERMLGAPERDRFRKGGKFSSHMKEKYGAIEQSTGSEAFTAK